MQALTGWLVQFKDVIRWEPYPVTFPHQTKQAAVHWSNPWKKERKQHVRSKSLYFMDGWTEIASTATVVYLFNIW